MNFPEKESFVRQAQSILNIKVDGDAGPQTWGAIGDFVGVPTKNHLKNSIIRSVQLKLGLLNDGLDGPKTWEKILEVLGAEKPQEKPQGKYPETIKLSPQTNGQYSQKIIPKAIVMHDTCGNYEGSIEWTSKIINPETGKRLYASYHCIVARDGRRTITNHDDNRAYHAGASSFKGRKSLNGWAIGVSFERDSHTEPLQEEAIQSAIEYIIPRMKKWNIPLDNVTDHRTISPNRKVDLKKEEFEKFKTALKKAWEES